jgi:hypothetical protein
VSTQEPSGFPPSDHITGVLPSCCGAWLGPDISDPWNIAWARRREHKVNRRKLNRCISTAVSMKLCW